MSLTFFPHKQLPLILQLSLALPEPGPKSTELHILESGSWEGALVHIHCALCGCWGCVRVDLRCNPQQR